jgi:murein DD-endopeptidase MepM/ murein hydrolase activator NlpD
MTSRWGLLILFVVSALTLVVSLHVPSGAEAASDITFSGNFVQGGLVIGRAPPGSRITLNGKLVKQRRDGRFLLGFGRDAKRSAALTIHYGKGNVETRRLIIGTRRYPTQRITGLPKKMVTPPARVMARIRADVRAIRKARLHDSNQPMFDSGFIWPAKGPITGVYGSQRVLNGKPRRPHYGVDVGAPTGTPVVAAASGIVRIAEKDMYFTGGTVLIDHGYGLNSVYSHLSKVRVKVGKRVRQGDLIGAIGATGRATGAHLDWRVNLFLTRLDPALLVGPMEKTGAKSGP